jgi:hypothetical protein
MKAMDGQSQLAMLIDARELQLCGRSFHYHAKSTILNSSNRDR